MTSSYDRNISRLKASARQNFENQIRREESAAKQEGDRAISDARALTKSLEPFSKHLKDWAERENKAAELRGMTKFRQDQRVNNDKLAELQAQMNDSAIKEEEFQELKAEYLRLSGPESYAQADRIAKLSPWEQVGYAKLSLKRITDTYGDRLDYEMQNNEQPFNIHGVTFSAKELRENNIQGLPFKELLVNQLGEEILRKSGYYEFTPEFRELAGANTAIDKVKSAKLSKVRERYNIDSSQQTRAKSELDWRSSGKTGSDLYRMLLTHANTVDSNNNILGNTGAWKAVEAQLIKEGVALADPNYANRIGSLEIPPSLARQLGVKQGTTFAEHWPTRFNSIKSGIKKGYVEKTNAELKFQKAAGVDLEAQFIEAARTRPLSSQEVNEWKRKFGDAGLPIPAGITNYETLSDRDQREDEDSIKALMASQNGYITNEQLDSFHPEAALEYREKASKLEKAALQEFDAEKKIKAHLDTAFTNMGIKGNEKSPAYVEAMANAKADYAKKFNMYVGMGYTPAEASHYALHADQVQDPEGKPIPDSMGVLTEIRKNGEGSKYVITGQSVERSLKAGHVRVGQIRMAKDEILNDSSSVTKKVIGGDYGHRQITTIKNNLDKYGKRGLYMDQGALQYYKGIARGRNSREGGWWGLVDAQLKAAGHEGLNPETRPALLSLTTGKDQNGALIPDRRGHSVINGRIHNALKYPSINNNAYILNMLLDELNYGYSTGSVWDQPQNLNPWLVGGAK